MTLLQQATVSLSAAKIGLFGKPGSGKTLSAIMILIGLAKRDGNRPIAMFDSEGGSDFVKEICDIEEIPFLVAKGRSFVEMREALREADATQCSGFLVDTVSEPWKELNEAMREKLNLRGRRLQFQHRDELYLIWGQWVRQMLDSRCHCVLSGRLSNEWDEAVDEAGDVEHIKVGTKMRGEPDAGYEPHLLIELDAVRDSLQRDKKSRSKRGAMVHNFVVLKDRFRALNGRSFQFRDINDYKQGMYEPIAKALLPHIERLAARGAPVLAREGAPRTSGELFTAQSGESKFAERSHRIEKAYGEIEEALTAIWPGQSSEEKRLRAIIRKSLFGVRSDASIKSLLPETLESAWLVMDKFEKAATKINPRDEAAVIYLITACKEQEREREDAVSLL